jgi:hypothetical protein
MDLANRIQDIAQRVEKLSSHIETEEATKTSIIMPFISALGYDVFNPLEVVPEFTADVGTKKGEKVDYAVLKDGQMIMLFECKCCGSKLDDCNASQLYRYFSVTDARFGILTNGTYYKFFSDLEEPNKMDTKPFFEFDLLNADENKIEELKKFTKAAFELDNILATASELKYKNALKKYFAEQLNEPSENFVRYFTSQVYTGRMTHVVLNQFTPIVRKALNQIIREKVNDRLQTALNADKETTSADEEKAVEFGEDFLEDGIVTTEEEIEGYNIVKAIVREVVDVRRVVMRDQKSYCGILLDDNNRKPIIRLHFNRTQKYISLFSQKKAEKVPIENVDDIFKYSDRLKNTVKEYIQE